MRKRRRNQYGFLWRDITGQGEGGAKKTIIVSKYRTARIGALAESEARLREYRRMPLLESHATSQQEIIASEVSCE